MLIADILSIMLKRPVSLVSVRDQSFNEEGFSLIELLITIVVLGILMAIAIPIYSAQVKEGLLSTLKADVTQTAGQVSVAIGKAGTNETYVYDPCTPENTFNQKMKVQTDVKNVITCHYYGDAVARSASEKKQAYNSYEWCVQGRRTVDIDATWHYSSRKLTVEEGACARIGSVTAEEAIG